MTPTLLGAVLVASLVGSLHCAGMCGPFVAFVVGDRTGNAVKLQAAYHGARALGYITLGAVAGAAGQLLDLAGVLAGLQPVAAWLAGGTLVVFGLVALVRQFGGRLSLPGLPDGVRRALRSVQTRALRLPPTTRALAIGATTALLPCGWLYAFVVTAAGTAAPASGALVMAAFWLGTVPILATLGLGVRGVTAALGPKLQGLAGGALVLLGLWTLAGRVGLDGVALAQRASERAATTATVPDPKTEPACCTGHATESTDR